MFLIFSHRCQLETASEKRSVYCTLHLHIPNNGERRALTRVLLFLLDSAVGVICIAFQYIDITILKQLLGYLIVELK